jgi:hypothetical protein
MHTLINFYSDKYGEIDKFLSKYYNINLNKKSLLKWEKKFNNPIEMAEFIGTFIDNKDKYKINMWISLDSGIFINVTESNANEIIKYLYERFPY